MKFTSKQTVTPKTDFYSWEMILHSIREITNSKKTDKDKITQIEDQLLKIEIENGIRPEAEQGNNDAQLKLAIYCYEKRDEAEAVKWFCKAKKQPKEEILFWLGLRCFNGNEGVKQDKVEAVKWFKKSAELGCVNAQNKLAKCYLEGIGIEQSDTEAVKWFCQAMNKTEQYSADVLFWIGLLYYTGDTDIMQDPQKAEKWFRKAAEQGHVKAQLQLGKTYVERDVSESLKWYQKAAEQGDTEAQFWLGKCYYEGNGVKQDDYETVKWYGKALKKSEAEVLYWLGLRCYRGRDVKRNYLEAVKWFTKSAEQGNADAQYILGNCYFEGKGVEEDLPAAVKWYLKAAEQGNAEAQCMLGTCYSNGEGVTQDLSEAAIWYLKAAEQGNAEALSYLTEGALDNGDIFQTDALLDKGLTISPTEMEKLSLAAKNGNPKAFYELGRLYDKTGNSYEARDCYIKALEGRYFAAAVPLKRLYLEKKVEYKRYEISL